MYALITPDLADTGKRKAQVATPGPVPNHPDKPYWVPIVIEITDTSTGPDTVASAWVETVEVGRLLRARTIRDKTTAELDAEDQTRVDRLLLDSGVIRALAQALFAVVNDVRVLNGDSTVTVTQFKTYLKGLIR